jgi:chromosome segregation ATPase
VKLFWDVAFFFWSTPKKALTVPVPDSRLPLREERLKEAMREALENERTAKSALFKREQAEAESERLREQYDVLVGQFEAIKSQVELEKLEAQGTVTRYERELEDVYGKLNAKDEYAGLLCGVKKDMDVELTDLWGRLETAEESRQKVEQAFLSLGGRYRAASARRIFNFMVVQSRRMKREALRQWREAAKADWDSSDDDSNA